MIKFFLKERNLKNTADTIIIMKKEKSKKLYTNVLIIEKMIELEEQQASPHFVMPLQNILNQNKM